MGDLTRYRETMHRRAAAEQRRRRRLQGEAQDVATHAAAQLKEQYGASRVVVFGSVADGAESHVPSDVDLAVWGLTPAAYLEAVAQLQACSPDFRIDLVRMEHCTASLRKAIQDEGRPL